MAKNNNKQNQFKMIMILLLNGNKFMMIFHFNKYKKLLILVLNIFSYLVKQASEKLIHKNT